MKKLLALLLVLVMLFSMFACTNTEDPKDSESESKTGESNESDSQSDSESNSGSDSETDPEEPTINHLGLVDRNFDGAEFIIWSANANIGIAVTFADEEDGTSLTSALVQRTADLEATYDVDIQYEKLTAWGNDTNLVKNMVANGSDDCDLVNLSAFNDQACMGIWYNLRNLPNINFDEDPWWQHMVMDEVTINGRTFGAAGMFSYHSWWSTYATYFNKTLLDEMGIAYPYQAVLDGKWTMDMMKQLTEGAYQDIDGQEGRTAGDRYGWVQIKGYLDGTDAMLMVDPIKKDQKTGELSINFDAAHFDKVIKDYVDLITSDNGGALDKGGIKAAFADNRVMFTTDAFNRAHDWWADVKFGVIPAPKLTEDQASYRCGYCPAFFAVPTTVKASNVDFVSFMMNAYAAAGKVYLAPTYFEYGLKGKYSNDNMDATMFDIIYDNAVMNHGIYWYTKTGQITNFHVDLGGANNTDFASFVAQWTPFDKAYVDGINRAYRGETFDSVWGSAYTSW